MTRLTLPRDQKRRKLNSSLRALVDDDGYSWPADFIEAHLARPQEARYRPGVFSVSGMSGPDDRNLAMQFIGRKQPPSRIGSRLQRIFDLGTDQHIRWQQYGLAAGITEEQYIEYPTWVRDLRLVGHIDMIALHPRTKKKMIIDFKTSRASVWEGIDQRPLPAHETQVIGYMGSTGIDRGQLIYINKDTSEFKVVPVQWNVDTWNVQYVQRISTILEYLSNRQLPPCPSSVDEARCDFAPMCQRDLEVTDEEFALIEKYNSDENPRLG